MEAGQGKGNDPVELDAAAHTLLLAAGLRGEATKLLVVGLSPAVQAQYDSAGAECEESHRVLTAAMAAMTGKWPPPDSNARVREAGTWVWWEREDYCVRACVCVCPSLYVSDFNRALDVGLVFFYSNLFHPALTQHGLAHDIHHDTIV